MPLKLQPQMKLYIYNRDGIRQHPKTVPFHFFGSSSKGNSVYLEKLHVLIDLGFPYKKYTSLDPNFFAYVDYVILTHIHQDHLNPATLKHILRSHPNVKFILLPSMAHTLISPEFDRKHRANGLKPEMQHALQTTYRQRFISFDHPLRLTSREQENYEVLPHITKHATIENVAIEITAPDRHLHLLYASDLDADNFKPQWLQAHPHFDGLPYHRTDLFNLIFLEANYDANLVHEALIRDPHDPKALGNLRHISEQQSWEYIHHHLSAHGYFVPLHASATYGTLIQDLSI